MAKITCSIDGCERTHYARGWCSLHYKRWRETGNPDATRPPILRGDPARRFWQKVKITEGCWEWTARTYRSGYGVFEVVYDRPKRAHRVAWELTFGPIPPGLLVCHHCDNRRCVRPDHLFLSDHNGNMADMTRKGRHRNSRVTQCPQGHPYDSENTYINPHTNGRNCRVCHREQQRKRSQ